MREVLRGERHDHGRQAEGDRGGRAVAGYETVGGPAHREEQQDCGDHRAEQRESPDDRRQSLHGSLDDLSALDVVSEVFDGNDAVVEPFRMRCLVDVVSGCAGKLVPAEPLDRVVERSRERRHAGALHGVEVAVDPGLVVGVPVPLVDLRLALGERLHLVEVRQLSPAHLVHDEAPGDPECDHGGHPGTGEEWL